MPNRKSFIPLVVKESYRVKLYEKNRRFVLLPLHIEEDDSVVAFDMHNTATYTDTTLPQGRFYNEFTGFEQCNEVVVMRQDIEWTGIVQPRQAIRRFIKISLEGGIDLYMHGGPAACIFRRFRLAVVDKLSRAGILPDRHQLAPLAV